MSPANATLLSAKLMPSATSMPSERTTCSAIARVAAREDASLDVLKPKMPTCLLPMVAATRVNALL